MATKKKNPTAKEEAAAKKKAAEKKAAEEKAAEKKAAEKKAAEEKAAAKVTTERAPETPIDSFFAQYLENLAAGKSDMAAVSLSNCYKAMLASKDEAIYKTVLDNFRDTKKFIVSKMLQGTTKLPVKDGAMVEIITTSFRMLILKNFTGKFNFKLIKSATRSDHFTTWFTKVSRK